VDFYIMTPCAGSWQQD